MSNNIYNPNSPSVKIQMPNQVNREPTLHNHHNSLTNNNVRYNNLGSRSVPFTSFEVLHSLVSHIRTKTLQTTLNNR